MKYLLWVVLIMPGHSKGYNRRSEIQRRRAWRQAAGLAFTSQVDKLKTRAGKGIL
jgi:hypothetical protein